MMMAMLHSNGQHMTDKDGDTEKGCQKPAVQQKTTDDDDDDDDHCMLNFAIVRNWATSVVYVVILGV